MPRRTGGVGDSFDAQKGPHADSGLKDTLPTGLEKAGPPCPLYDGPRFAFCAGCPVDTLRFVEEMARTCIQQMGKFSDYGRLDGDFLLKRLTRLGRNEGISPETKEGARRILETIVVSQPVDRKTLAGARLNLGEIGRAMTEYGELAKEHPGESSILIGYGTALVQSGKEMEGIEIFDRVLSQEPDHRDAWFDKGRAWMKLGKPARAALCFERLTKIAPESPVAWNNLGVALRTLGRLEEALACYNSALRRDKAYEVAWTNRGTVLLALERTLEARRSFERAIEYNPSSPAAKEGLRQC